MSGIVGKNLGRGSGVVKATPVGADTVSGASIADDAIDSEHYTDGSIDNAHIADDAIDSEHYADGSIDNAHIADDAIDSEHYADGSIDNAHIADDAIDSEHYADGSIDNAHIADDAIDSEHYAAGSIDTAHIATNQIDETLMKDAFVGDFTDATVTASDYFLHGDATDSGNTKKDTIQGILDLAGGGGYIAEECIFTLDMATATGTFNVTGLALTMEVAYINYNPPSTSYGAFNGWMTPMTGTNAVSGSGKNTTANHLWHYNNTYAQCYASPGSQELFISAASAGQFTVTHTKVGSQTGTAQFSLIIFGEED